MARLDKETVTLDVNPSLGANELAPRGILGTEPQGQDH